MRIHGAQRVIRHVHRVRIYTRRLEQQKYIFKDGRVQVNTNPFALLNRRAQDSSGSGVLRFVPVEGLTNKLKKGKV